MFYKKQYSKEKQQTYQRKHSSKLYEAISQKILKSVIITIIDASYQYLIQQYTLCHQFLTMKINKVLLIFIAFSLVICRKLKFIEVVTRHGVRYPSYPNNYDHSNISFNPHLKNQLTIQGKSMHYLLGKQIYQRYWKQLFGNTSFNDNYSPSLIYAKSTNTNRTIESLQSQLLGLLQNVYPKAKIEDSKYFFPPFQGQQARFINNQKEKIQNLFTVPIHVQKGAEGDKKVANLNFEGDFLVKQQPNLCPNQLLWEFQNYKLQIVKQISSNEKIKKALQQLNIIYNQTSITIQNAFKYVDNYRCLKAMGQKYLPFFQEPLYQNQLQFLYIARLYISYYATQQQKRTFATRLLQQTLKNMKNSLDQHSPKIVLYAAHDITISTLLVSFNFSNIQCIVSALLYNNSTNPCYTQYPAFASSFIFEFWEEDDGTYNIAMLINGKYMEIPVCNSKIYCSFSQIEEWFDTYRVENPNRQCGVVDEGINDIQAYLFAAFSIGVLVSCCFQLYNPKKQELFRNELQKIEQNESLYS